MNFLDALNVKKSDYAAVGYCNRDVVFAVKDAAKGVTSVNCGYVPKIKHLRSTRHLDVDSYDKVLFRYQGDFKEVEDVVKSCDHMGLALVSDLPVDLKTIFISYLESKGIYEWWEIDSSAKKLNVLFKVRKYDK